MDVWKRDLVYTWKSEYTVRRGPTGSCTSIQNLLPILSNPPTIAFPQRAPPLIPQQWLYWPLDHFMLSTELMCTFMRGSLETDSLSRWEEVWRGDYWKCTSDLYFSEWMIWMATIVHLTVFLSSENWTQPCCHRNEGDKYCVTLQGKAVAEGVG